MQMIFGADSKVPATTKLINGYDLYSWTARINYFPAFWGRNISGENAITKEEIEFLRSKNCKIALIFDDLTEKNVACMNGEEDALRAINAAKALGVEDYGNVAIFAKIGDSWGINNSWMHFWAFYLHENGYTPGFMANTDSSQNFNFGRQCSHFVENTLDKENYGTIYWATEPKVRALKPETWAPYCPSALRPEKIDVWQVGSTWCGDIHSKKSFLRDKSVMKYMW